MKRGRNILHVIGDAEKVFQSHGVKGQGHRNVRGRRHTVQRVAIEDHLVLMHDSDFFFSVNVVEYYKQLKTTAIFCQDNNNRRSVKTVAIYANL